MAFNLLPLKLAFLLPLVPETSTWPWFLVLEPQFSSITFDTLTPLCSKPGLEMPNLGLLLHLAVRAIYQEDHTEFLVVL